MEMQIDTVCCRGQVSRRTNAQVTLSEADATRECAQLRCEVVASARPDAAFAAAARARSDCSSYKQGGDLGTFQRGSMQATFEDAAFALEIGEISPLVHSDSGVHIILRIQ